MVSLSLFFFVITCDAEPWVKRILNGTGKENYMKYDEYLKVVDEMVEKHPNYLRKEEIGKSVEDRSLFVLILEDTNSKFQKKEVLFTAGSHPMEALTPLAALDFVAFTLDQLEAGAVGAQYMLQQTQVVIDLFVNPDGIVASDESSSTNMRKNRANVCTTGGEQGVDIDLNFPDAPKPRGGQSGSSECSDNYGGKEPFDQPESEAIKKLVETHKFVISLSVHGNGHRVVYPDGATRSHQSFFRTHKGPALARQAGSVSRMQRGRKHKSSGGMVNWLYKEHNILAACVEAGDQWRPPHMQKEAVLSGTRTYMRFLVAQAGCSPKLVNSLGGRGVGNFGRTKCEKLRIFVSKKITINVGDVSVDSRQPVRNLTGTNPKETCMQEENAPFCVCGATKDTEGEWYRATDARCNFKDGEVVNGDSGEEGEEGEMSSASLIVLFLVVLLTPFICWLMWFCYKKIQKKKKLKQRAAIRQPNYNASRGTSGRHGRFNANGGRPLRRRYP